MEDYTSVEDQFNYGLDNIGPDRIVEIRLRDFVFITKSIEELNRFFHQPMHYPSLEDIIKYLGNVGSGAYSLIHKMYYEILFKYLPQTKRIR